MVREETRVCRICGEEKPLSEFRERKEIRDDKEYTWHMRACRVCERLPVDIHNKNLKIQCVFDPTDTYTNAWFTCGAFKETLDTGYWPPGSVWEYGRSGNRVIVKGNELWHMLYDKNDNLKPRKQKAVRYEGEKLPELRKRTKDECMPIY